MDWPKFEYFNARKVGVGWTSGIPSASGSVVGGKYSQARGWQLHEKPKRILLVVGWKIPILVSMPTLLGIAISSDQSHNMFYFDKNTECIMLWLVIIEILHT